MKLTTYWGYMPVSLHKRAPHVYHRLPHGDSSSVPFDSSALTRSGTPMYRLAAPPSAAVANNNNRTTAQVSRAHTWKTKKGPMLCKWVWAGGFNRITLTPVVMKVLPKVTTVERNGVLVRGARATSDSCGGVKMYKVVHFYLSLFFLE